MKVFISAGEPSGDMHAALLVKEFKKLNKNMEFIGLGGKKMEEEGVQIIHTFEDISVVGFQEVLGRIKKIRNVMKNLVRASKDVDFAVFVDFPGFNLKLAKYFKINGKKTFYYIIPQVWAWGGFRIKFLKRYIDRALVIFPFEETILKRYGVEVNYVGHPVVDFVLNEREKIERPDSKYVIGLLPGSREDEIRRLLPRMLKIKREIEGRLGGVHFLLSLLQEMEVHEKNLTVYEGKARPIAAASDLVIAASGTAALEVGLMGKPLIVLYALSELSWHLAHRLAKTEYISLINILLGEKVHPEFVQHIHPDEIAELAITMLKDVEVKEKMEKVKKKLFELLGPGGAPRRAASIILDEARKA